MILISDFVPNDSKELKDVVGKSLICFVTLVCFLFVLNIIITVAKIPIRKLRRYYLERKQKVVQGKS
jgi:hypothetical protein